MGILGTLRSIGQATGLWKKPVAPLGCSVGTVVFREARRSATLVNFRRPAQPLDDDVKAVLSPHFPELDLDRIRVRTRCRLPANRFNQDGSIYAMTFGYDIFWRDDFDASKPDEVVKLAHEVMHVEQVRRLGGESEFACAYGTAYLDGGGDVPDRIRRPTAYHRNEFEAEAYRFEDVFRSAQRS